MTLPLAPQQLEELRQAARRAAAGSYAPYSRFPVGAAVLAEDGRTYGGANVENASLGLTCCAERVAIFTAVSAGNRRILALAVFTPTPEATPPCGACRQVLAEFGPRALVVCQGEGEARLEGTLAELFPAPFGAGGLPEKGGHD